MGRGALARFYGMVALLLGSALACGGDAAKPAEDAGKDPDSGRDAAVRMIDRSAMTDVGTAGRLDYATREYWVCRPDMAPNECDRNLDATEIKPEPSPEPPAAEAAQPEQTSEPPKVTEPPGAEQPQPATRTLTYAATAAAVIAVIISGGGLLWMANQPPAPNTELNTRLAALEAQLRAVAQRPAPQADNRPLEVLTQRIAKLEETAGKPAPAATPDTSLIDRIAALEAALAALQSFDAQIVEPTPEARHERRALVAEAGHALWLFVVQRESIGLRDTRQLMRDYRVPADVQSRMGMLPVKAR